ncbi:MAG TPA: NADH-quinone oxidoreductase subunit J [Moorella mulderi]|nr:NADH-quinone oxidoreductase subunit J [Moorella mulderi]
MPDSQAVFFWLLAALVIGSALAVVLLKNIVHSALYLFLTFVGVAGLYILLHAEFLAAVQLLIYAGAIAVLIVFAVMLVRRGDIRLSNLYSIHFLPALVVSLVLFALVAVAVGRQLWLGYLAPPPEEPLVSLARNFLGEYVIAFEVAAILLLSAIVGAVLIVRGRRRSAP